jgi:SAM-dependent methyltransferase
MPNVEQMDYWNGAGGEHWVAEQVRYDEINAEFGARVVAALAPRPGDRVLDVGCGNGALSLAIAPLVAPAGFVVGLDISAPMLEVAAQRAHAGRVSNAIFEHGDAQTYQLEEGAFDAMVSRFGVMFFDDSRRGVRQPCTIVAPRRADRVHLLAGPARERMAHGAGGRRLGSRADARPWRSRPIRAVLPRRTRSGPLAPEEFRLR